MTKKSLKIKRFQIKISRNQNSIEFHVAIYEKKNKEKKLEVTQQKTLGGKMKEGNHTLIPTQIIHCVVCTICSSSVDDLLPLV